jgi:Fic/DOC family
MRYLSFEEVVSLHSLLITQSGGSSRLRDRGGLESAVAQPEASFGGEELYPTLAEKAAALGDSFPGLTACVANNPRQPWEPHKYELPAAQDALLEGLVAWVADYYTRDDQWSYAYHQARVRRLHRQKERGH